MQVQIRKVALQQGEQSWNEIKKPDKITIMVNSTVTTKANNRDAFEKRWEELTGIDLKLFSLTMMHILMF